MSTLYNMRFVARNSKGEFTFSPEVYMGDGYYFMFGHDPIFETVYEADVPKDIRDKAKEHYKFQIRGSDKIACYTNGCWFTKNGVGETVNRWFETLEARIVHKYEWEKLKRSLDYMKLSDEEKDNVAKEYGDVDERYEDDPDFTRNTLETLLKIKGMLEMYEPANDDNYEVYGFLYDGTSEPEAIKEEEPTIESDTHRDIKLGDFLITPTKENLSNCVQDFNKWLTGRDWGCVRYKEMSSSIELSYFGRDGCLTSLITLPFDKTTRLVILKDVLGDLDCRIQMS